MNPLYEWDEAKRQANLDKHQLDFEDLRRFAWESAITHRSDRFDEPRWIAFGIFESRLHAVVFTLRGEAKRIISFRPARTSEVRRHG